MLPLSPETLMAGIALEQLSKHYPNGVVAVADISLTVPDGELLVLVGPSGCGKTTTLRLIAGLERPDGGQIRIGEDVVNDWEPHRRKVAMVFQRPALYPHLSVRDNLAFGLRLNHPASRWRQWLGRGSRTEVGSIQQLTEHRVTEAAGLLGLKDVLDRRPAELSGGQQQRVALGRAIVRRPAVFLLDEPLSGLDAPLRAEMRRELHLLHRRLGTTMIYVTHDQAEAMALGDRVAVMDQGTLQQVDRPLTLYQQPCNRFVAAFIGWPPMNWIEGRLDARDGQLGFAAREGWLPLPGARGRNWAGRPITLGIRPQHVKLGSQVGMAELNMEVVMIEPMGGQSLLTLQQNNWQLTALLDGSPSVGRGQTVTASIDMEQTHLFDRQTGISLTVAGEG